MDTSPNTSDRLQLVPPLADARTRFQAFLRDSARRQTSWQGAASFLQSLAEELHWHLSLGSPVRLKPVSDAFGIAVRFQDVQGQQRTEGTLRPVPGGFVATVFRGNPNTSLSARERFTLAHEIGHCLFFVNESRYALPRRVTPAPLHGSPEHRREEGLCNDFARALLIPSAAFGSCSEAPTAALLSRLSQELEVSIEPLIRRAIYDRKIWPEWSFAVLGPSTQPLRFLHGASVSPGSRRRLTTELAGLRYIDVPADRDKLPSAIVRESIATKQSVWFLCSA